MNKEISAKEMFNTLRQPKYKGDPLLTYEEVLEYINATFGLLRKVSKINLI